MENTKVLLSAVFLFITITALCQSDINTSSRNTFFIEAGGNTYLYSLNYDRLLTLKSNFKISGRVGIMYFNSFSKNKINLTGVPIEFSFLRGKGNNFFEVGLGVAGVYFSRNNYHQGQLMDTDKTLSVISTFRIGYRHQKIEGGMFYKIGFTPMASFGFDLSQSDPNPEDKNYKILPWMGASIGWTLKN